MVSMEQDAWMVESTSIKNVRRRKAMRRISKEDQPEGECYFSGEEAAGVADARVGGRGSLRKGDCREGPSSMLCVGGCLSGEGMSGSIEGSWGSAAEVRKKAEVCGWWSCGRQAAWKIDWLPPTMSSPSATAPQLARSLGDPATTAPAPSMGILRPPCPGQQLQASLDPQYTPSHCRGSPSCSQGED